MSKVIDVNCIDRIPTPIGCAIYKTLDSYIKALSDLQFKCEKDGYFEMEIYGNMQEGFRLKGKRYETDKEMRKRIKEEKRAEILKKEQEAERIQDEFDLYSRLKKIYETKDN